MKKIIESTYNFKAQVRFCQRHGIFPIDKWLFPCDKLAGEISRYFAAEPAAVGITYPADLVLGKG